MKTFSIVIEKSRRLLHLYEHLEQGERLLVKTYRIALGSNPSGPKSRDGDGATPEGEYYITHRNPASRYYLSLGISYPNQSDARRGYAAGLITARELADIEATSERFEKPPQGTALGGEIFIHGGGTAGDWTAGCIALENGDITELFESLPLKTWVSILA